VENANETALGAPGANAPQVYFSALQYPPENFDLIVRAENGIVFEHAGLAVAAAVPLAALRARAALPARVSAIAALVLGFVCGLIAVFGLYSTTAGMVSAHAQELGVRASVGATPAGLVLYAAGRTLRLALIGIVLGFASAYGAQTVLEAILPGAQLTLRGVGIAGLLVFVATMTGVARPAWGAARVDPALALAR
jgi:hypothetical protein